MITLVVNNKEYLINTEVNDKQQDETISRILEFHPTDSIIDFI